MGRRGPPKKPTALKLLHGAPGGRSKLPKGEVMPEVIKDLDPPEGISDEARYYWDEMAPRLKVLGLLTNLDVYTFRRYCELLARWHAAARKIKETGSTHVPIFHELTDSERARGAKPKLKYLQELPESLDYRRIPGELLRIEQQFGMTPSARASIAGGSNAIKKEEDVLQSSIKKFLYG